MNLEELLKELVDVRNKEPGRIYSPLELTAAVRPILAAHNIKVRTKYQAIVLEDQILLGGYYLPTNEWLHKKPSITINLVYRPGTREINIDNVDWWLVCTEICSAITHEKIHQRQWNERNFDAGFHFVGDGSAKQRYYGEPDEIEAHAAELASNLVLRKMECVPARHNIYTCYVDTFHKDHYIVKLMLKHATKYYKKFNKEGGLNV